MEYSHVDQKLCSALVTLWHPKILKGLFILKVWKFVIKTDPNEITATILMSNEQLVIESLALATVPTYGKTSLTLGRQGNSIALVCFCWRVYCTHNLPPVREESGKCLACAQEIKRSFRSSSDKKEDRTSWLLLYNKISDNKLNLEHI